MTIVAMVKVFDESGHLQLEICPEGRRRLIDPWDVAVLPPPPPSTTHAATTSGRYVVTDRGASDVKVYIHRDAEKGTNFLLCASLLILDRNRNW